LQLRSKIVLGQPEEVLAELEGEDTPDLVAVKTLAQHAAGDTASALHVAQELAEKYSENATVQVLCGTVLHAEGQSEEALALLMKHQGNLEAYVLFLPLIFIKLESLPCLSLLPPPIYQDYI
jgi:coatomer protein complex subunit epsilon